MHILSVLEEMFWHSMSGSRHSSKEALSSVEDERCLLRVYDRRMVESLERENSIENPQCANM